MEKTFRNDLVKAMEDRTYFTRRFYKSLAANIELIFVTIFMKFR